MNQTIHPLLVHFPIALLSVYAVAELLRFRRLSSQPYWFYLKAVPVLLGTLGAVAARWTGEAQVEAAEASGITIPALVRAHEAWSLAATVAFGVLALAYLLAWVRRDGGSWSAKLGRVGGWASWLVSSWLAAALALVGLATLTVTGALGATLVYGPNIDPTVSFIYRLVGQP